MRFNSENLKTKQSLYKKRNGPLEKSPFYTYQIKTPNVPIEYTANVEFYLTSKNDKNHLLIFFWTNHCAIDIIKQFI